MKTFEIRVWDTVQKWVFYATLSAPDEHAMWEDARGRWASPEYYVCEVREVRQ